MNGNIHLWKLIEETVYFKRWLVNMATIRISPFFYLRDQGCISQLWILHLILTNNIKTARCVLLYIQATHFDAWHPGWYSRGCVKPQRLFFKGKYIPLFDGDYFYINIDSYGGEIKIHNILKFSTRLQKKLSASIQLLQSKYLNP